MKVKIACSLALLLLITIPSFAQQPRDRVSLEKEIKELRSRLKSAEDAYLSPANEDRAAYPSYVDAPDRGLIRLLPREKYDRPDRLTVRGGGAYYSFSRLTHEYGNGSDIELANGQLSVGFAGADYGMIYSLGERSLEEVTLDTPGVSNLAKYEPASLLAGARQEQRRAAEGNELSGVSYRRQGPAVVNTTYIIRSINYDDSDVLVAFRVVREDADGSVILAWRMLKKYSVPQLAEQAADK